MIKSQDANASCTTSRLTNHESTSALCRSYADLIYGNVPVGVASDRIRREFGRRLEIPWRMGGPPVLRRAAAQPV